MEKAIFWHGTYEYPYPGGGKTGSEVVRAVDPSNRC
jgi:hypothetical protein